MFQGNLQLKLGHFLLDSGAFSFDSTGVTVLFGRSGSGKSTLLRALSGLDRNTRGQLKFGDEVWQDGRKSFPVEQRDLGFVFQTAALLPGKTVRSNLEFAIKRVPKARQTGGPSSEEIIERVQIDHLIDRSVDNLSGGERQRVAIARALLTRPRLLMMDEPLSALDWRAKAELLALLESIIAEYQIPVLYITHAPIEVERLASRIVFMADGRITSIETLAEATARVDSPLFTEEGPVSVLHGVLDEAAHDDLRAFRAKAADAFTFWLQAPSGDAKSSVARLRILARDVALAQSRIEGISMLNQVRGTVSQITLNPANQTAAVFLTLADQQTLIAEITQRSLNELGLSQGKTVYALIKTAALLDQ
ncbi:molybdenum ABC transporter ATP-binding protein [Halothiobacillus sp. DCM-1]|uniref:molybdenum ABC transporter ATP-binding protein n=1 Tax=Halothiobacillus sp. DCM-1 TaxID=3112558 RepID=UPI00324FA769